MIKHYIMTTILDKSVCDSIINRINKLTPDISGQNHVGTEN